MAAAVVNFPSQGQEKRAAQRVQLMLDADLPLSQSLAPCRVYRSSDAVRLTWLSCQILWSCRSSPQPGLPSWRAAGEGQEELRAAFTAAALTPRRRIRRKTLHWWVKQGQWEWWQNSQMFRSCQTPEDKKLLFCQLKFSRCWAGVYILHTQKQDTPAQTVTLPVWIFVLWCYGGPAMLLISWSLPHLIHVVLWYCIVNYILNLFDLLNLHIFWSSVN